MSAYSHPRARSAAGPLLALGSVLLLVAAVCAAQAAAHMSGLGVICGAAAAPHCPWCGAASLLAAAGAASLALGVPRTRPQRATA